MPSTLISDITNGLRTNYGDEIVMSLVDSGGSHLKGIIPPNSIIGRLAVNNRIFFAGMGADRGGAKAAEFPVYYSAGDAQSFSAGDPYPTASAIAIAKATAEWARYWIPMQIDGLANYAAQGNSIVGSMPAVGREYILKVRSLFSTLENHLVRAQSGTNLAGVKTFMTNTGSYQGISLTNNYWQPALKDGGAADPDLTMVREIFAQLADHNARVDEIWCSRTQYNKLEAALASRIQYIEVQGVEGMIRTFTLDGVPVYPINTMEASANSVNTEIWFVNTSHLSLHFLPQEQVDPNVPSEVLAADYEGYPIGIKPVETGTDAEGMVIKCYPQLVCKNPSQFGAIFNLNP